MLDLTLMFMWTQQTHLSALIPVDILLTDKQDRHVKKNPAAQALGKLGGTARAKSLSDSERSEIAKQGATARAHKLSASERSEIARKAVQARIAKQGQQKRRGDA
jgi:hypothetical protein